MRTLHVIGAGLSGLSAGVYGTNNNFHVVIHEATNRAGGRCRSFYAPKLGNTINNGNHLILGANKKTLKFLDDIGARNELIGIEPTKIPFLDLRNGRQWILKPGAPWWPFLPKHGIPDIKLGELFRVASLLLSHSNETVAEHFLHSTIFENFWSPLAVATLNTDPVIASAHLFSRVVAPLLYGGEQAYRPHIARSNLTATFIDPAITLIRNKGGLIYFNERLQSIELEQNRVCNLRFSKRDIRVNRNDYVVLALPPVATSNLLPWITVPLSSSAIINAHYLQEKPVILPGKGPLLGIIGGISQWLFTSGNLVSVTVSGANNLLGHTTNELSRLLWKEVSSTIGASFHKIPPHQIIKEQRATFAQTPAEMLRRPSVDASGIANLKLAGDWTDTGLPATIESSIKSGYNATFHSNL